jgi:23S rRNA (guanosine2251-2'-O)-methyltransferase
MLELRNPHSILATIARRPRAVKSIQLPVGDAGEVWNQVASAAAAAGIRVSHGVVPPRDHGRRERDLHRGPRETERAGSGTATVEPPSPVRLEQLWTTEDQEFGLWLALDQVQDPQNLGALFRLAGFFGVRGVLLTRDRSAPVNGTVCDIAAGGVEFVPFAVVANLAQALDKAKQSGIWTLGTCERATSRVHQVQRDRSWILVLGNEGNGLRRLTRDKCDQLVSLPASGPVPSLNVATAAAACLALLTAPVAPRSTAG